MFRTRVLVAALGYGLPLVPHTLAGWALEMSDRAILARLLPLHDVGVYSLGYQLGAVLGLLTTAFNAAWVPLLFGTLKAEGEAAHGRLARLATYYAMVLCFIGLGWSLLVEYAIVLFAGPEFREAHRITPWVVGGYVFAGLYLIPTNLLFWRQQTKVFPLVTLAAGAVNVGLNLWLVPQYGTIAAAWSTLAAYATLLLLTWRSAERIHPFPYEYRRVGLIVGIALALFLAGRFLPFPSPAFEVTGRVLLWLAFPLALVAVGGSRPRGAGRFGPARPRPQIRAGRRVGANPLTFRARVTRVEWFRGSRLDGWSRPPACRFGVAGSSGPRKDDQLAPSRAPPRQADERVQQIVWQEEQVVAECFGVDVFLGHRRFPSNLRPMFNALRKENI